jgi:hypothetical protein
MRARSAFVRDVDEALADVEPRFETFTGDDPRAFILGANIHRPAREQRPAGDG